MAITIKKPKALRESNPRPAMTAVPGQPCPVCGQRVSDPANRFNTGAYGDVPVAVREADAPLEPDGETWYRVLLYLREGQSVGHIAEHMALTTAQVQDVADEFYAGRW
jgi:hypothetical protein